MIKYPIKHNSLCQFDMYQNVRPQFGTTQVGDMFEKKIDELLSGIHIMSLLLLITF